MAQFFLAKGKEADQLFNIEMCQGDMDAHAVA